MAWMLDKQINEPELELPIGSVFLNEVPLVKKYPTHFIEVSKSTYNLSLKCLEELMKEKGDKWFLAKS
jgi:hypothetical protein